MAHWRDRLIPGGKFRGVSFFVEASERGGGRRTATHEYPFRDDAPYVEDTGAKGITFNVAAYVIGAEYVSARDALLSALEKSGPGELIHPYHGTRRVMVESYRVRETQAEGGWAKFSIEFAETSTPLQPAAVVDGKSAVIASAASAKASVSSEFLAAYNEAATRRDAVANALRSATLKIDNIVGRVSMEAQAIASIKQQADQMQSGAASLAGSASGLLAAQAAIIDALAEGLRAAVDPVTALLALYGFDPGVRPIGTTPSVQAEQANFDATKLLIQRLVVVQAALLAIDLAFPSFDDAARTRTAITDLLDDQSEIAADDTYPALLQLRTDLVAAVPGESTDLPRLLRYTPPVTLPSLVVAHRLYGDLDGEADLIARNRVKHPAFVLGNVELQVLSRD